MNKKNVLFFAINLLIVLAIIACSSTSNNEEGNVTLTMWHNYGGDMQSTMDYLIDKFNATIGKEKGIVINVTAISSSSELNKSLDMIAAGDPGAQEMPDIFTGYPKVAMQFYEKNMLIDYNDYFTEEELDEYVNSFIEEGRLEDDGLYVFPIAKSTEVLYLNQTLFDEFEEEVPEVDSDMLQTFEGIAKLSELYYNWTDSKTPEVANDGKQFYSADSWFNFSEVGMQQLGTSIIKGNSIKLDNASFKYIFENVYNSAVKGGIAIYDGYSSDLSKTGDLVCSTGSSAGILFYGDTITYKDGTVKNVEYSILPYPVFQNGSKVALQRGGGLMVAKTDERRQQAACEFVKWITKAEQNLDFVINTGYLPVTKTAFEEEIKNQLDVMEDSKVKQMLIAVLGMYEEYSFFIAPTYSGFDDECDKFEENFKKILNSERENYLQNGKTDISGVYDQMTN